MPREPLPWYGDLDAEPASCAPECEWMSRSPRAGGGGRHQHARYGGERQDLGHCDLLFVDHLEEKLAPRRFVSTFCFAWTVERASNLSQIIPASVITDR